MKIARRYILTIACLLLALATPSAWAAQPEAGSWEALLRESDFAWPAQPEQVTQYGTTWLRVRTKYFRLHCAPDRADEGKQIARRIDGLYEFLAHRAQCRPPTPIDAYIAPTDQSVLRIYQAWYPTYPHRVTSLHKYAYQSVPPAFVARPATSLHYRLGSATHELTHIFEKHGRGVRRSGGANMVWWRGEFACDYFQRRLKEELAGRSFKAYLTHQLQGVALWSWATLATAASSGRGAPARIHGINAAVSAYYFVEERFGAEKQAEFWRGVTDAGTGHYRDLSAVCLKVLGQPIDRLQQEWARFYGLPLHAFIPITAGSPSTQLRSAAGAVTRGDYDGALQALAMVFVSPGSALSADQWAYAYYAAGYALDATGHRGRAIEMYELGLLWAGNDERVRVELQRALLGRPTRFHQKYRMRRFVRLRPIDLLADTRVFQRFVGKVMPRMPFTRADGHFDRLTADQKRLLADRALTTLQTGQAGNQRWEATETLGLLKDRRALPLLHQFLATKGDVMGYRQCWVAARALGRIGARESIPHLIRATASINRDVRGYAAAALTKLTGQHFRKPDEWRQWWTRQGEAGANPIAQGDQQRGQ